MTLHEARSVPLFTSGRERRLWAWTLAVAVAIYSTLGLARTLADELRSRELLGAIFFWGMVLIAAAIVTLALKTRPGGAEIGVGLGVAAVYLMAFSRMGMTEERTHLFEYGVVAIFIHEALTERASQGGRVFPAPAPLAILAATLIGMLDEAIQFFLPSRVFDPVDIGFNTLAAVMAVTALEVLESVRRR